MPHQPVPKPLRDTQVAETTIWRYRCVRCDHTFRVYPPGVSRAQTTTRLRGAAVMLYILGLSYGAVSLALKALGHPLSKTSVYTAVQAAGAQVPGLRRDAVRLPAGQRRVAALGADLTSVKCPEQDRQVMETQTPRPVRTALRLRLSAALHAVANVIEPAQHDPACAPSPQR